MSGQKIVKEYAGWPWVQQGASSLDVEPCILGLECGWIYMTWAVLCRGQVLDGAVVLNEDVLEAADTTNLAFADLVTRRLYGLQLIVANLLNQWSPSVVADWSPEPTWNGKNTLENYLAFTYRHGQSQGIIKGLCFKRGIRVMGIPITESIQASTGQPDALRDEVEAALRRKLAVAEFAPRHFSTDDGRQISDNFAGALAVAYAAQQRILEQGL